MWRKSKTRREYMRALPGGGFVAIDVTRLSKWFHRRRYRGTLIVERRADARWEGHSPPVIAEASGTSVDSVVQQLLPCAEYNPAIGAALLQRERAPTRMRRLAAFGVALAVVAVGSALADGSA